MTIYKFPVNEELQNNMSGYVAPSGFYYGFGLRKCILAIDPDNRDWIHGEASAIPAGRVRAIFTLGEPEITLGLAQTALQDKPEKIDLARQMLAEGKILQLPRINDNAPQRNLISTYRLNPDTKWLVFDPDRPEERRVIIVTHQPSSNRTKLDFYLSNEHRDNFNPIRFLRGNHSISAR